MPSTNLHRIATACALLICTGAAFADPPQGPSARCTSGGMVGHAFTQSPPGRAEYRFSGACITRDGSSLAYRVEGTWTGLPGDPANANASEIYHVDRVSGPARSYIGIVGFRCPADPWLNDVDCVRVGENLPDDIEQFWAQLAAGDTPTSGRGLLPDQRVALLDEYRRANRQLVIGDRADVRIQADAAELQGTTITGTTITPGVPVPPRQNEAVMLNPQPLPPVETPAATSEVIAAPRQDDHSATGIIIVGGKPVSASNLQPASTSPRLTPKTSATSETRP